MTTQRSCAMLPGSSLAECASIVKKKDTGLGLELNITKAIVERFNGKIGYTTTKDAGTPFYFIIPTVRSNSMTSCSNA